MKTHSIYSGIQQASGAKHKWNSRFVNELCRRVPKEEKNRRQKVGLSLKTKATKMRSQNVFVLWLGQN